MKKLLIIFEEALMISVGILFVMGIYGLFAYWDGKVTGGWFPWYMPFSVILTGFLSALATDILPFDKDVSKAMARIRIGIHFLLILLLVSGIGYFSEWYHDWKGYAFVLVSYVIIYIAVWIFMWCIQKHEENLINQLLEKTSDKE